MTKEKQEQIREIIQSLMCYSLEGYNLENIIDDSHLTKAQKRWAYQNLDWKVVIL